jgi:hypothetical protein
MNTPKNAAQQLILHWLTEGLIFKPVVPFKADIEPTINRAARRKLAHNIRRGKL